MCDVEHPMDITMSRVHLTSDACHIYFMHTKVNHLLYTCPLVPFEDGILLDPSLVCIHRCERSYTFIEEESKKKRTSTPSKREAWKRRRKHQEEGISSQATPCPRASKTPCARATQRVCAGAPHAHGPVPCPRDPRAHGPNLPRAHGLIRMDDYDLLSEPLFLHFVPKAIYSVPRPFVRVRRGYVRHMRALLHGSTPLGDQDLLLE